MRRDPKIKKILSTDSQKVIVDKLNSNFLGVYSLSGGILGERGHTGNTGPIGLPGPIGVTGNQGVRGNRWFIDNHEPQGGTGDSLMPGDYWIDSSTDYSTINKFGDSGWINSGYNLASESEFERIDNILNFSGATSGNAITYKRLNGKTTFNFSDVPLNKQNSNPLNSMFIISTDGNESEGYSLLEFSRGDLVDGTPSDYLKHPKLNFLNNENNNSSVTLLVPRDRFTIKTLDTTDTVSQDITFNIDENFIVRSSDDFELLTGSESTGGILINSSGNMSMNTVGFYKPNYSNLGYDPAIKNRILINSRFDINTKDSNKPVINILSKLDSTTSGFGTLEVALSGGNFIPGATGYKPDNYAIKIATIENEINTDKFYVSSAGSIYYPKESKSFTYISERSTNNFFNNDIWYLFSNIDFERSVEYYGNSIGIRKSSFANDKNEIIIDPIGFPENYNLCVGLQLNPDLGISYQNNLKNTGETFKVTIRSANPNIKIAKVGITKAGGFTTTSYNNYYYPTSQISNLGDGVTSIELVLVKQSSNLAGDLVYFKSEDKSGIWEVLTV